MTTKTFECPVCRSGAILPSVSLVDVPVCCNALFATREEACAADVGDIELGYCSECGHMFNTGFEPDRIDYSPQYDTSLHYSPEFSGYAERLADRLMETYRLKGKRVIEIGCGKGDFLRLLCRKGMDYGIGFDRSVGAEFESGDDSVILIRDYFHQGNAERYAADFVCCRHVLEHIPGPTLFLNELRASVGGRKEVVLYFEVPNLMYMLKQGSLGDIIYEHCSYFSPSSLERAFLSAGFDVLALGESFGGQYLYVEARSSVAAQPQSLADVYPLTRLSGDVLDFNGLFAAKVAEWEERLNALSQADERAAVWGIGSKGVTFLNLARKSDAIDYAIDINPRKHGKFVPLAGTAVVSPETLKTDAPDTILLMNPIYRDEVERMARGLGSDAEIIVV